MTRRVRLLEFCQRMAELDDGYHTVLTPTYIHQQRCRAKKAGRPDPYPFVIAIEGLKWSLVDLDLYDQWAAEQGRPLWPVGKRELEESAR
ncbi:MAG: hypothetical protein K2X75_05775 [Burkholderiaceae bacterium]|nr:hypothetical protein [Burkholderiaceae bacterium]